MFECSYSREPVDFRLLTLRILKKVWLIPISILGGAGVLLGFYLLYKTVLTGRTYQVENIYYIDFNEDSSGKQYDWVNQYTWSTLADMDVFIEGIYEDLDGSVSKEAIKAASDCTVESDGRYLYLRVTTHDPELSLKISASYEKTLFAFCEAHKEFNSITKEHAGEARENSNIRIKEISILGGVLGFAVLCIIALLLDVCDTSIYIPSTLEKRYHIKTLGAPSMPEFKENVACLIKGKTGVIGVDAGKEDMPHISDTEAFIEDYCNTKAIKECDSVVVMVKAGNHNGKRLERVLEQLLRNDICVTALLLVKEDEALIRRYYKG